MFEMRGRLGLVKQKALKMLKGSEREVASVSPSSNGLTVTSYHVATSSVNHMLEVELEKARALTYYRRMLDTPK